MKNFKARTFLNVCCFSFILIEGRKQNRQISEVFI